MNKTYLFTAIQAAIEAGKRILDVYHTDYTVEQKDDASPLTLADKRAHTVIHKALSVFPIPFMSEEGRAISYAERKHWHTYWLVDPLDGTKEFIKKNDEFTVNIALIEANRPSLGVIYVPVKRVLYFSSDPIGAYTWHVPDSGFSGDMTLDDLIQVSRKLPLVIPPSEISPTNPYTIVGSRSHATTDLTDYVEKKKREHEHVTFISAGSSLKLCLVAEGRAHIYPRLGPTMEWDTAAGQAIVQASGRTVTDYETGLPLVYNKENLLNPWFIVQ